MPERIKDVNYFKCLRFGKSDSDILQELFNEFDGGYLFLTSSYLGALSMVLSYFRETTGYLEDKNSEVWVPKWMETWKYNIIQKHCFPSTVQSDLTRGIIVFHQNGYPQNLNKIIKVAEENNWFLIEDCTQAIMSYYNGKRVGLYGDAGIYSLSKFFPSLIGGIIVTKNERLGKYIEKKLNSAKDQGSTISFLSNLFYEKSNSPKTRSFWGKWIEMSSNTSDLSFKLNPRLKNVILRRLDKESLTSRNENRDFFYNKLADLNILVTPDNREVVTPYIIPLITTKPKLNNLYRQLRNIGLVTGLYYFDIKRDMIDPNFRECVWLPVHEGISEKIRTIIVNTIVKYFKA